MGNWLFIFTVYFSVYMKFATKKQINSNWIELWIQFKISGSTKHSFFPRERLAWEHVLAPDWSLCVLFFFFSFSAVLWVWAMGPSDRGVWVSGDSAIGENFHSELPPCSYRWSTNVKQGGRGGMGIRRPSLVPTFVVLEVMGNT